MDNLTINQPKILFVEGQDSECFFLKMLRHLNISDVQVYNFGGIDEFRNKLKAFPNIPGYDIVQKIGIIRDAEDAPPKSAFQSITDVLRRNNLNYPEQTSVFTEDEGIKTGIYILPDNTNQGMLEDLILTSLEGLSVMECIEQFIICSRPEHSKLSKSKLLCYFAYIDPKAISIYLASKRTLFDFDNESFLGIKKFLLQFN